VRSGIRLHSKFGVNATIPLCFWCGKERNEVVLLGAAYRGEAPKNLCLDREPCDKCAANMAKGITIMEAREKHGPTGRWVVVTEEAVQRLFQPESTVEAVLRHRKAYMEPEVFQKLFGDHLTKE